MDATAVSNLFRNVKFGSLTHGELAVGKFMVFLSDHPTNPVRFMITCCTSQLIRRIKHYSMEFNAFYNETYKSFRIEMESMKFTPMPINKDLFVPSMMTQGEFDSEMERLLSSHPTLESKIELARFGALIQEDVLFSSPILETHLINMGYMTNEDFKLNSQLKKIYYYCGDDQLSILAKVANMDHGNLLFESKLPMGVGTLPESEWDKFMIPELYKEARRRKDTLTRIMVNSGKFYFTKEEWSNLKIPIEIVDFFMEKKIFTEMLTPEGTEAIFDTFVMRDDLSMFNHIKRLHSMTLSENIPIKVLSVVLENPDLRTMLSVEQMYLLLQILTEGVVCVNAMAGTGKSFVMILSALILAECFPHRNFYIPTSSGVNCNQNMVENVKRAFENEDTKSILREIRRVVSDSELGELIPGPFSQKTFETLSCNVSESRYDLTTVINIMSMYGTFEKARELLDSSTLSTWLEFFENAVYKNRENCLLKEDSLVGSTCQSEKQELVDFIKSEKNRRSLKRSASESFSSTHKDEVKLKVADKPNEKRQTKVKNHAEMLKRLQENHTKKIDFGKSEKIINVNGRNVFVTTIASLIYNGIKDSSPLNVEQCGGVFIDENTFSIPELTMVSNIYRPNKIVVCGDTHQIGPLNGNSFIKTFSEAHWAIYGEVSRFNIRSVYCTLNTNFRTDNPQMRDMFHRLRSEGVTCLLGDEARERYKDVLTIKVSNSLQQWKDGIKEFAVKMKESIENPEDDETYKMIVSSYSIRQLVEESIFGIFYPNDTYGDLKRGMRIITRMNRNSVFNGEEKVIESIKEEVNGKFVERQVNFKTENFDDRTVAVIFEDSTMFFLHNEDKKKIEYELSTARTRQGTEYDHVCFILPFSESSKHDHTPRDVYVSGITRAKKTITIVGPDVLERDCKTHKRDRLWRGTSSILAMKVKELIANDGENVLFSYLKDKT